MQEKSAYSKARKKLIMDSLLHANLPKGEKYDALILDGQANQALVCVRSLGRKGLLVAVMGNYGTKVPAFSSKWCALALQSPAKEATKEYAGYLLAFLKQNKVGVIMSSSDGTVSLLQKYRKQISKYAIIALAANKPLTVAINKHKTLAIAKRLGIKIPLSYTVKSRKDIATALKRIPLPLVIKPTESWTQNSKGRKRVAPELATTAEETYRLYAELTEYGGETIFQEYLPGRREAIAVLYQKGKFPAVFAQWTKRTQPPLGGTSVLRESIALPNDTTRLAKKLVRAINLEGYSLVEFRRDKNGTPCLMEINPRLTVSIVLAYNAGYDFPYLLYLWAKGIKKMPRMSYRTGLWQRHLAADIINMVESIQQRGRPGIPSPSKVILNFIITFFQPMKYDNLEIHDMLPVWSAVKDSIGRNIKKIITGF